MKEEEALKYDVFISYRWVSPDQEWVRRQLYPALVSAGLKVCLDVEEFIPGRAIIREMERAETESRRVLCIISPAYFEEERMVEFESLNARGRDPGGRLSFLIPLIFREAEIPPWIRGLVSINWTDPNRYTREWKKLLLVLEAPNKETPYPGLIQRRGNASTAETYPTTEFGEVEGEGNEISNASQRLAHGENDLESNAFYGGDGVIMAKASTETTYIQHLECIITFQSDLERAIHEYRYEIRNFQKDYFEFRIPNTVASEVTEITVSDGEDSKVGYEKNTVNNSTELVFSPLSLVDVSKTKNLSFSFISPTKLFLYSDDRIDVAFYRAEQCNDFRAESMSITLKLPEGSNITHHVSRSAQVKKSSITFIEWKIAQKQNITFPIFFYRKK